MLAICWCSKLAPHPGRAAVLCQSLVKTLARAAFPMPGVSSGLVGMQPLARPETAQGRSGLLGRPQPGLPGGPHLCQLQDRDHDGRQDPVAVYERRNRVG